MCTAIGSRLLFLLHCDLLPNDQRQVLQMKDLRDYPQTYIASDLEKILAAVFLFSLNAGMLVYVFYFAVIQSHHEQDGWFGSLILWMFADLFLISTFYVLMTHVWMASAITNIHEAKLAVVDLIRSYHHNTVPSFGSARYDFETGDVKFNSTTYQFVSARVSKQYPELKESQIISKVSSPLPRQFFFPGQRNSSGIVSTVRKAVVSRTKFLLGLLLRLPLIVQDLLVESVIVLAVGAVILLHIELWMIHPAIAFVPLVWMGICCHFWIKAHNHSQDVRYRDFGNASSGREKPEHKDDHEEPIAKQNVKADEHSAHHTRHIEVKQAPYMGELVVAVQNRGVSEEVRLGADRDSDEADEPANRMASPAYYGDDDRSSSLYGEENFTVRKGRPTDSQNRYRESKEFQVRQTQRQESENNLSIFNFPTFTAASRPNTAPSGKGMTVVLPPVHIEGRDDTNASSRGAGEELSPLSQKINRIMGRSNPDESPFFGSAYDDQQSAHHSQPLHNLPLEMHAASADAVYETMYSPSKPMAGHNIVMQPNRSFLQYPTSNHDDDNDEEAPYKLSSKLKGMLEELNDLVEESPKKSPSNRSPNIMSPSKSTSSLASSRTGLDDSTSSLQTAKSRRVLLPPITLTSASVDMETRTGLTANTLAASATPDKPMTSPQLLTRPGSIIRTSDALMDRYSSSHLSPVSSPTSASGVRRIERQSDSEGDSVSDSSGNESDSGDEHGGKKHHHHHKK